MLSTLVLSNEKPPPLCVSIGGGSMSHTLCLGDYFSEGYKEYFINTKNLRLKDNQLYQFIKEL